MEHLILNSNSSLRSVVLDYDHHNFCENGTEINFNYFEDFFGGIRKFFYLVTPQEAVFEKVEDVPNYFQDAWSYFILFIFLENLLLWLQKQPTMRFNDGITSLSHGLAHESAKLVFKALESYSYIFIYEKFRLLDLSHDNLINWYVSALAMDFFYYWGHRASHEIHILWAQHQVHHSSEDFNTAVGVRQSVLQGCSFLFYLPMAFVIPPTLFITHQHFNLLYQFWIHTEVVKTLGPLEYIFNTPQHHRVHHGSNIWCLDKNYGGVLIIWDRMFGTFASEDENEEIIYGLVVNKPSFNILQLQTFYTIYTLEKFSEMKTWSNRARALFFGPSWYPGGPRLGTEENRIKVGPREKYDVKIPTWCNIYILAHFCVILYGYHKMMSSYSELSLISISLFVTYIFTSLTSIGMLLDNHQYGSVLEIFRCMIVVFAIQNINFILVDQTLLLVMEVFYLLSGLFWFYRSINLLQIFLLEKGTKKTE